MREEQPRFLTAISCVVAMLERGSTEARQKNDEEMASIAGANYTNDASLKQPHTLITVDSDEIGGVCV